MEAPRIRRAGRGDAETRYAIHCESVLTAYAHIFPPERYPFPEDEMRAHWVDRLDDPGATALVADREGRSVGFVIVARGWLESMFVVPDEWRHGTGSALHDQAVAILGEQGGGARLWVLEENARARRFYERRGWHPDGERQQSGFPPYPVTLRYVFAPAPERRKREPGTHP